MPTYLTKKLGDSKNNNELAMAKIRIARLFNLINETGLKLEIDTSRFGYRIENEHGRYLSPILKNTDDIEYALELMYNAIREFQTIK